MPDRSTVEFVDRLSRFIPELGDLRVDHVSWFGELLPHVLFGEITRWAEEEAARDVGSEPLRRFLALVEAEWPNASPDVESLLTVSFLENIDDGAPVLQLLSPALLQRAREMGVQMAPPAEVRDWLVAEVQDVLLAGRVGLYEFIWILRSRDDSQSLDEMRATSRAALEKLREIDNIVLVQMVWPRFAVVRWPAWSELDDNSWNDVDERPYYAIVYPDDIDEEPPEWVWDELRSRS